MEVDLNKLYASFSKEYASSSIKKILEEQYPELHKAEAAKLADYITLAKDEIEDYFYERYNYKNGAANQKLLIEGSKWVRKKYPWMNEENFLNTANRAMYYAWHG